MCFLATKTFFINLKHAEFCSIDLILILTNISFKRKDAVIYKRQDNESAIFCDPCSYENQQIIAKFFCKTCDPPEPLCDDCAQQHSRQKLSRDHELCDDMKKYPNLPLEKNQEYVDYFIFWNKSIIFYNLFK